MKPAVLEITADLPDSSTISLASGRNPSKIPTFVVTCGPRLAAPNAPGPLSACRLYACGSQAGDSHCSRTMMLPSALRSNWMVKENGNEDCPNCPAL
jgi:hypothetical protein